MTDQARTEHREPVTPTPSTAPAPAVKVSVIMATYNRGPLLVRLLKQIALQTYPMGDLEVVIVDDGSKVPVAPVLEPLKKDLPYPLTVITQANAGAAAARQNAAK